MLAEFLVLMYRDFNNLYPPSNAPALKKDGGAGRAQAVVRRIRELGRCDDLHQATGVI